MTLFWGLLFLVLIGTVLALVVSRSKPTPQRSRVGQALTELRHQTERVPHLREPLRQAQTYGQELTRLIPEIAEVERFLGKETIEGATRDRLLARHNELVRVLERGTEYLENLGAELVLVKGNETPDVLEGLPDFLSELRQTLHVASPHQG